MGNKYAKGVVYLNTPIRDIEKDIIGVDAYVDKIESAIDEGAQMIAVTSPFGTGKTSMIELLDRRIFARKTNERVVRISMWSQLDREDDSVTVVDLHRSFLFQLASQIDHSKGTYISRRLSPNYGLIKLHASKKRYWWALLAITLLVFFVWILNTYPDQVISYIPCIKDEIDTWKAVLGFSSIVIALWVFTKAEIIYSTSQKAEIKRSIEFSEIVDIYRSEILKYPVCRCIGKSGFARGVLKKFRRSKQYIVVVEDLDRTADPNAVEGFLKELRKYYIPQVDGDIEYRNKVVFIINVKPETLLRDHNNVSLSCDDGERQEPIDVAPCESLYAKLFDYVLNLQRINVDNFDALLEGLLQEKKEEIKAIGLSSSGRLSDMPGMGWIIREPGLEIRMIKKRLNITFSLYESLVSKFDKKTIALEKCAVVAYLTTAYEHDFYCTGDRAYQELIDLYLKHKLSSESCSEHLSGTSESYIKAVIELIDAKLIDTQYRTYFYNYPKGSYLYNTDEAQVVKAILYAESNDSLEEIAQRVVSVKSYAISRSLNALNQLGLPLPPGVFTSETLYVEVLRVAEKMVLDYISNLDYSDKSISKTVNTLKMILSYDRDRMVYNQSCAEKVCRRIEAKCNDPELLQFRLMLSGSFAKEILWYKRLFFGSHPLICISEMGTLSLSDLITLVNTENADFSEAIVSYIIERFETIGNSEDACDEYHLMEEFLREAEKHFDDGIMAPYYLKYMNKVNRIVPDFERSVQAQLESEDLDEQTKRELLLNYQKLVNNNSDNLTQQTIDGICNLDEYGGYLPAVSKKLKESKCIIEYILIQLCNGDDITFDDESVARCLERNLKWLLDGERYFPLLRERIAALPADLLQRYVFMFALNTPVLTERENEIILEHNRKPALIVISLVPSELVTEENYMMLCSCFNRQKQSNKTTIAIIEYVASLSADMIATCFYALDFSSVRYRYISNVAREGVKRILYAPLDLEQPKEKLRFMEATHYLDATWEMELLEHMMDNRELEDDYVEVVNMCDALSKSTTKIVSSLANCHAMSSLVNSCLIGEKKYVTFVCSETLGKSQFVMDDSDQRQDLWAAYLEIFTSTNSKFSTVREHMLRNYEFLRRLMSAGVYASMNEENRMGFSVIFQSAECITDVMRFGEAFALRYFLSIAGFADEAAAKTYVEIVTQTPSLLASDALYMHTHHMLVSGSLKARYTTKRKREGYCCT